ncbi:MAG: aminodeoxychorismate/anthranilate synthase component I, partial [Kiloniellales bacterium]|nr:aminodeoxychorismate/anthranilate synthase component I [Kiloniellales bacterium]
MMSAIDAVAGERPLVREIGYGDPLAVFAAFAEDEGTVFLDSARPSERLGQYSFIAVEPFR